MANADRIEIPANAQFVKVSGKWLAACGKGNTDKLFPITQVCGRLPGGAVVVQVQDGKYDWTVIVPWRGEFA